jgi:dTDP-4-amino-4,6-dideoxygalactose transaminase
LLEGAGAARQVAGVCLACTPLSNPLHWQVWLAQLIVDENFFPRTLDLWTAECLSLPLFFGMIDEQARYVMDAVRSFFVR